MKTTLIVLRENYFKKEEIFSRPIFGLGVASSFVFTPLAGATIGLSCDLGTSTGQEFIWDIAREQVNCERSLELFSSNQVSSEKPVVEAIFKASIQNSKYIEDLVLKSLSYHLQL